MSLLDPRGRRGDRWADQELVDRLVGMFRAACAGAGVAQPVDAPISGTMLSTPTVVEVILGPPTVLIVQMLPGQLPEALRRAARFVAPHLAAVMLRVEDLGRGYARVTLLDRDPLAAVLPLPATGNPYELLLGRDEGGQDLEVDALELPHIICQGQTRSGKSTWLYALLAQLSRRADVLIAGVDPSGITLRPFESTRHAEWQTLGLASLAGIEKTLAGLVVEMDRRLAVMPVGRDVLPVGFDMPLILAVLDEWPATLRALDAADPKQGRRVRGLVARLLAESHKVGFRLVLAAQRAEASIVGAAERAQCGGRLSFRVDSIDSIKLLHADAEDLAADHTSSPPGIALLSWPGRPITRIRGPFLDYAGFCAAVGGAP